MAGVRLAAIISKREGVMSAIWEFVKDPDNRAVLGWIGGGAGVLVAGIWAVVKFLAKNGDRKVSGPNVSADRGSVAVGGDIKNSRVHGSKR